MEYCKVHNSTDDATFAAKKIKVFAFYLSRFIYVRRKQLNYVHF
jgi:hypothetical protein